MARNKPRILLALYSCPQNHTNHIALLFTGKIKRGAKRGSIPARKWHAKNTIQLVNNVSTSSWRRERNIITDIDNDLHLLACAVIAKVHNVDEAERLMNLVPVYQPEDADQDMAAEFDSTVWAKEAMKELRWAGIVKATLFTKAEDTLRSYVETHRARFDAQSGHDLRRQPPIVPVIDMFTGKVLRE